MSDVARVFDVLGWFSPTTVKMKILQWLWEAKLDWDDPIPDDLLQVWSQWRSERPLLTTLHVPRYYMYSSKGSVTSTPLHGFSDASEDTVVLSTSVLKTPQGRYIQHLWLQRQGSLQLKDCRYLTWSYVEPKFLPSYSAMLSEYSMFPLTLSSPGLTAPWS